MFPEKRHNRFISETGNSQMLSRPSFSQTGLENAAHDIIIWGGAMA